jgi:hypothetical protein
VTEQTREGKKKLEKQMVTKKASPSERPKFGERGVVRANEKR